MVAADQIEDTNLRSYEATNGLRFVGAWIREFV